MSAESDYADAVSRILLQQGHARALGAMGSGKAWAGFAQQLGDLPGQLYGQYQQMKGFEQDQAARDQQMAIRDSDSKLRQQQAGFEAEDRQRAAEIRRQATDALRGVQGGSAPTSPNAIDRNSAGQPSPRAINEASDRAYGQIKSGNTDAVFSQLPPEARVVAEKWYQDFSAGDQARQAQAQAEGKRAAQMIRALNYDPVVAGTAIRLLGDAFPGAKDALGHTTDPKQLRTLVDYYATIGDKPPDPFTLNPGDTRFSGSGQQIASAPRTPSQLADDDIKQRQLAGMSPTGLTAEQQAANAFRAREVASNESNARIAVAREAREGAAQKQTDALFGGGATGATPTLPTGQRNEAFLATLPTPLADKAKALVEGRLALPTRFTKGDTYWQSILDAATKYDPAFDAANYNSRSKTRQDFTSGKSAQTVNALNTVAQHLERLSTSADALQNTWAPYYNSVANYLSRQTGSKVVTNFETDKKAVVDELTRAWRQAGGTEQDIKSWSAVLDAANSPTQLHGSIAEMGQLLEGKLSALESQYQQGMGTDKVQAITPAARAVLTKLQQKASGSTAPQQQPIPGIPGGIAESTDGGKTWHRVK